MSARFIRLKLSTGVTYLIWLPYTITFYSLQAELSAIKASFSFISTPLKRVSVLNKIQRIPVFAQVSEVVKFIEEEVLID